MALFKNRLVLLILGGIVLAGMVWYSFMRDGSAPLLQTTDLTRTNGADSDIVQVLLQLRAVSLAGTIFTDPVFQSLQDYGSEIIPEPVGRSNPFAPLGNNSVSTTSTRAPASAQQPAPTR